MIKVSGSSVPDILAQLGISGTAPPPTTPDPIPGSGTPGTGQVVPDNPLLDMAAVGVPGANVVLGLDANGKPRGPNRITARFGGASWAAPKKLMLTGDGKAIMAFYISADSMPNHGPGLAYSIDGQSFVAYGNWPNGIKEWTLTGDVDGVYNTWKYQLALDGISPVFTGPSEGCSGDGTGAVNCFMAWVTEIKWSTAQVIGANTPPVVAEPTRIDGKTVQELLDAAAPGAVVPLPGGRIRATFTLSQGKNVQGNGPEWAADNSKNANPTIIDGEGLNTPTGKAIIEVADPTCWVRDLTVCNVKVKDGTESGIRGQSPEMGFHADNVEIHSCPNGSLQFWAPLHDLHRMHIHHNGIAGKTCHGIYNSGEAEGVLNLADSWIHDNIGGHAVKCRSPNFTGTNNRVSSSTGKCYDFPQGGKVWIEGGSMEKPLGSDDHTIVAFGEEGDNFPLWGVNSLAFKDVKTITPNGNETFWLLAATPVAFENVTDTGLGIPGIQWLEYFTDANGKQVRRDASGNPAWVSGSITPAT